MSSVQFEMLNAVYSVNYSVKYTVQCEEMCNVMFSGQCEVIFAESKSVPY